MPAEVHEHEYDNAGRLVRTVVLREPLWTEADVAQALELEAVEAGTCTCGCGLPLSESMDKTRAFDVIGVTCFAQRAIQRVKRAEQTKAEQSKTADGWDDGRYWLVKDSFPYKPESETEGGDE